MNYSNLIFFKNQQYNVIRFEGNNDIIILEQVFYKKSQEFLLIDLKSYSIINSIKTQSFKIILILNDKIVFSDNYFNYFIYKIETKNNNLNKIIDSKYICNFNSNLKLPHLYLNPYLLPCGNSACLNCIYMNYNLYKETIKCNFKNCNQEHILYKKLIKNDELSENMKNNCQEILKCLIDEEKNLLINTSICF